MKKIILILISLILTAIALVSCDAFVAEPPEQVAPSPTQTPTEPIAPSPTPTPTPSEQPSVDVNSEVIIDDVMSGAFWKIPETVIADVLESFFGDFSWEHNVSPIGDDLVIFTGEMLYDGNLVKVSIQFNHTEGMRVSEEDSHEFKIESMSFNNEMQNEFTSQLLLYSMVGERPDGVVGTWRSREEVTDFLSDGTGAVSNGSDSIDFVWMVYNDRFYANVPSTNNAYDFKLTDSRLRLFFKGLEIETLFTMENYSDAPEISNLQLADGWNVITSTYAYGYISIIVPPAWTYRELSTGSEPWTMLISGEGDKGHVEVIIFDSPIGNPYMIIEDFPSQERFQFDDGHIGYMLESSDSLLWLYTALGNLCLNLWHFGDRSIFTENEDLILRIARSVEGEFVSFGPWAMSTFVRDD